MAVYRVGGSRGVIFRRHQMCHQLMTKEVKVDPAVTLSAGSAAKDTRVKTAGGLQVGDWEGEVETGIVGIWHGRSIFQTAG